MMKSIIAAAFAALSVNAAYAAESAFPDVEPAAIRVSTSGLNLGNPRDIQTLQTRINKAINAACNPHGSYFAELAPERECRARLTANTNQILAGLTKKAEKSQMAEF
jgi:UrcA family protein